MTSHKLRLAAISALTNSLGIFVTALFMVLVLSLVHRAFAGTWYVNWRLMLTGSGVLTCLLFAFFFGAQVLELATDDRRKRTQQLTFPAVMWLRWVYLLVIAGGLAFALGALRERDPWWMVVLAIAFVFLGYFPWPKAITISENAVRQRRVLLGLKQVRFDEVESIVYDPTANETIVFGKNGERIVHTNMHVQPQRFIRHLQSLTGKHAVGVGDLEAESSSD